MKKHICVIALLLSVVISLAGCGTGDAPVSVGGNPTAGESVSTGDSSAPGEQADAESIGSGEEAPDSDIPKLSAPAFDTGSVPAYSGKAYVAVNGNVPYFTESEHSNTSFEQYSNLDSLSRCGVAFANIGTDIMPTGERGSIGMVKPSGWQTVKYDNVDGKYLYNRCHLIGFQLSGENANEKNLITGTRYMNVSGMLPFENMVADYVKETDNHVLYRVTPIFEGNNLVASGVLMEALSMGDGGSGICFNVYCYNVQPGIKINYANGSSEAEAQPEPEPAPAPTVPAPAEVSKPVAPATPTVTYIANINTKKFHYSSCSSVKQMNDSNKLALTCSRDSAVSQGYVPCKRCNP